MRNFLWGVVLCVALTLAVTLIGCGGGALSRGQSALGAGDLVQAESEFRAALLQDPSSEDALYGLGWTYHLAGQTEEARAVFAQLLQLHPGSALGHKGMGSVLMAAGNPKAAREELEAALAAAPTDRAVRHSLGLLSLQVGELPAALAAFDALAQEAPEEASFQLARSETLLRMKQEEQALEGANRALELAKGGREKAMAWMLRGRALAALGTGRVDTKDCAGTAPQVHAVLDQAEAALDEAEALQVPVPELADARRSVQLRRGGVDDACPGMRPKR